MAATIAIPSVFIGFGRFWLAGFTEMRPWPPSCPVFTSNRGVIFYPKSYYELNFIEHF